MEIDLIHVGIAQKKAREKEILESMRKIESSNMPKGSKTVQIRSLGSVLNGVRGEIVNLVTQRDSLLKKEAVGDDNK